MQENRIGRRDIDEERQDISCFKRKVIFNWRLLKEKLEPNEVIDALISDELVEQDLWERINKDSRRSKMDSILTNVTNEIQTSDELKIFEDIVTKYNRYIKLKTPGFDHISVDGRVEKYLQANREIVEKELYPKYYIDIFLELFILSLEDHEWLRNIENVRQKMATFFLDRIMEPSNVEKGSTKRLTNIFRTETNKILTYLSHKMEKDMPNGIFNSIGDKDLQRLIMKRDGFRNFIICHWAFLKENFNPFYIMDDLLNNALIDEDREEIIRAKPRREQVDSTLRNIVRRIDRRKTFWKLISILKKENSFIADKLLEKSADEPLCIDLKSVSDKKAQLDFFKADIVEEFYPKDVDTFLERHIVDIDDHEVICEAGTSKKEMALGFFQTISEIKFIKRGSFDCLIYCLKTNDSHKKIRRQLAKALLLPHKPEEVINRTVVTATDTAGDLYPENTSIFTEGELVLTFEDEETKDILENETLGVGRSTEHQYREIEGLKLIAIDAKKSSVVVHLKSTDGNVKYVVEQGIANGDLTSFIRNLLDNEKIKMHMSPKTKYKISVIVRSKDKQVAVSSGTFKLTGNRGIPTMRIIQANRLLLEEEYDPLPLINAICNKENVRQYKSVSNLPPESRTYLKQLLMGINTIEDRRKRVQQFFNIAEDKIEADKLWDFIKDTANAFLVKKIEDDCHGRSSETNRVRLLNRCPGNGLVYKGTYEVEIIEKDLKSPLQSLIVEKKKKKAADEEYRSPEGVRRRQQRREKKLNEDVEFWKNVRNDTLPNLNRLREDLITANNTINTVRITRNFLYTFLIGTAVISIFAAGFTLGGAILELATTACGLTGITLLIETYVEKEVLKKSQEGIDRDKEATINLLRRVRVYRGTDRIPLAERLYSIQLESIDDLARDPIGIYLNRLIDLHSASLINAIDRITEIIEQLEIELQEVERVQGLHSLLV